MARMYRKLSGFALACALALLNAAGPGVAGDRPLGVVELFTSQGCSSCPPADAVLGDIARKGDVVALAYHVDYWNNLGWTDTLSSRQSTERQFAYARGFGRRTVYTPQVVVNGRDHLIGADRLGIERKLAAFDRGGRGLGIPVEVKLGDGTIGIGIGAGEGAGNVVVVYFTRKATVDVRRGENRGRRLTYWHSVRDIQTIAMWKGEAMSVDLPRSVMTANGYDGCAVLLQTMRAGDVPGAIVGAGIVFASGPS